VSEGTFLTLTAAKTTNGVTFHNGEQGKNDRGSREEGGGGGDQSKDKGWVGKKDRT
jgi:hypothetical protein